jgi:hypothetical protein
MTKPSGQKQLNADVGTQGASAVSQMHVLGG